MRPLALLLAAVSLPVFAAVGCGQNETASSATALAPAGSLMYGEIDLDPSGDQKRAIEQLAAQFPGEGSADTEKRRLQLLGEDQDPLAVAARVQALGAAKLEY